MKLSKTAGFLKTKPKRFTGPGPVGTRLTVTQSLSSGVWENIGAFQNLRIGDIYYYLINNDISKTLGGKNVTAVPIQIERIVGTNAIFKIRDGVAVTSEVIQGDNDYTGYYVSLQSVSNTFTIPFYTYTTTMTAVNADRLFTAVFPTYFYAPSSQTYVFSTEETSSNYSHDDDMAIFVNGTLFASYRYGSPVPLSGISIPLNTGNHSIVVVYNNIAAWRAVCAFRSTNGGTFYIPSSATIASFFGSPLSSITAPQSITDLKPGVRGLYYNNPTILNTITTQHRLPRPVGIFTSTASINYFGASLGSPQSPIRTTWPDYTSELPSLFSREWQVTTMPNVSTSMWTSIAYGNGVFVAFGYGVAAYSLDGITWTSITGLSIPGYAPCNVCFGNGIFVAIPQTYTDKFYYSYDGVTWSTQTRQAFNGAPPTYTGDRFVFKSDFGYYSLDGINWSYDGTGGAAGGLWSPGIICAGPDKLILARDGSMSYSPKSNTTPQWSGVSWSGIGYTFTPLGASIAGVTYGNGIYVAIGGIGPQAGYSYDGINWYTTTKQNAAWRSVAYGNGMFIAVGDGVAAYTVDGINWKPLAIPVYDTSKRLNWELMSDVTSYNWWPIAFGGNKFVTLSKELNTGACISI